MWSVELFCKNRRYLLDEDQSKNPLILLGDVGCNYFAYQSDNSFIVGQEEFMEMRREQILEDIVIWRTP